MHTLVRQDFVYQIAYSIVFSVHPVDVRIIAESDLDDVPLWLGVLRTCVGFECQVDDFPAPILISLLAFNGSRARGSCWASWACGGCVGWIREDEGSGSDRLEAILIRFGWFNVGISGTTSLLPPVVCLWVRRSGCVFPLFPSARGSRTARCGLCL